MQASVVRMCVCMCVCQHFQTYSPLKLLGQLKPNFIKSLLGAGKRKFVQTVVVTWPRWPPCPYMLKTLKRTKRPMTSKFCMQHWVLEYYQVCSNDDPGMTLTYFTSRPTFVPYAFVWGKGKTLFFFFVLQKLCRLWSETSNRWPKWQEVSVDIHHGNNPVQKWPQGNNSVQKWPQVCT